MSLAAASSATERGIQARQSAALVLARLAERERERQAFSDRQWQDRAETYRENVQYQTVPCCVRTAPRPLAASIIVEVAAAHGLTSHDLKGPWRKFAIVRARHEAMWRIRQETTQTLPQIGRAFGGRDHTTALHGIRKHQARIDRGEVKP